MIATLKNKNQVRLRFLQQEDEDKLLAYFAGLSPETRKRFGPHPFDAITIHQICTHPEAENTRRYIAEMLDNTRIIAYMLIKNGVLSQDENRLLSYGISPSGNDCTFAPSVADAFQSSGLGSLMLAYILNTMPPRRIILWGGVQASNVRAVSYYTKFGFYKVGSFTDHNGENFDMIRDPQPIKDGK